MASAVASTGSGGGTRLASPAASSSSVGGALPAPPAASSGPGGGALEENTVHSSPRRGASPAMPAAAGATTGSPSPYVGPIQMLKLGYEQKVVIPMQLMLKKVMASLNSPSQPKFCCVSVGESSYLAYVQLDVSTTRFTSSETEPIVTIDGQHCASAYLAEESAARNAFDYLARRHRVFVLDYSKNLAQQTRDNAPCGQVNLVIHEVEDALDALQASIARVEKLRHDVYAKEMGETVAGLISPAGSLYKEVRVFLDTFLQRYMDKYKGFMSGVKEFEDERAKHRDECIERVRKWRSKGLLQPGWVTEKDVLGYVLTYFGISEPEYWKESVDGGYIGYVKIDFGDLDEINCYGKTTFRGYKSSSAKLSEQYAACDALKEVERLMNVIIVDFNRDERVDAENEHKSTVSLLNRMIDLSAKLKVQCTDMLETINSACQVYGCGPEKFSSSRLSNEEISRILPSGLKRWFSQLDKSNYS